MSFALLLFRQERFRFLQLTFDVMIPDPVPSTRQDLRYLRNIVLSSFGLEIVDLTLHPTAPDQLLRPLFSHDLKGFEGNL